MDTLPIELKSKIISILPDYEIQKLQYVNSEFRQLSMDRILWIYIIFKRNPVKIQGLLNSSKRPNRKSLVERNILRASSPQQLLQKLERGDYINGVYSKTGYEVYSMLQSLQNQKILQSLFNNRPDIHELEKRNIVNSRISPALAPIQKQLHNQLIKRELYGSLMNRVPLDLVVKKKLISDVYSAELLCPSIQPKIKFYNQ